MAYFSTATSGISKNINARLGRIDSSVVAYFHSESDNQRKKLALESLLYNKIPATHGTESIVTAGGMTEMHIVEEGGRAGKQSYSEIRALTLIMHQYLDSFQVTKNMVEDSNFPEIQRGTEQLARAYYKAHNKHLQLALANGFGKQYNIGGKAFTDYTIDGLPLFHKAHLYTKENKTQSNRFSDVRASGKNITSEYLTDVITELSSKLTGMYDEEGTPTGYIGDMIIVPAGNPKLRGKILQAVGSFNVAGTANNDINVQYGNWSIITLPLWMSAKDEFIVMSSEANRELMGNLFLERVGLEINTEVSESTASINAVARAREAIGFGNYKHAVHFESLANGQTALSDGKTAGTDSTAL